MDNFNPGDMVSWNFTGSGGNRQYGIILEIIIEKKDWKKVAFAKVVDTKKKINLFVLGALQKEG